MSKRVVIAIEGINGIGKTTAIRGCRPHLLDVPNRYWWFGHEHQDGVGLVLREQLQSGLDPSPKALALLFAAARIDSYERRCADQHPKTVLVYDRFLWSSLAYHSVRCDELWVRGINQQSPQADFNILLDADPNQINREDHTKFPGVFGRNQKFLQQVRQNFLELTEQNPGRSAVIDATQPSGIVATQLADQIKTYLRKNR